MSACNRASGGYCAIVPGTSHKVDGETCKEGCADWQLVAAVSKLTETLQDIARNGTGA